MGKIIRMGKGDMPSASEPHECDKPKDAQYLPMYPIGTIWQCDCGNRWVVVQSPTGRHVWMPKFWPPKWFNVWREESRDKWKT